MKLVVAAAAGFTKQHESKEQQRNLGDSKRSNVVNYFMLWASNYLFFFCIVDMIFKDTDPILKYLAIRFGGGRN